MVWTDGRKGRLCMCVRDNLSYGEINQGCWLEYLHLAVSVLLSGAFDSNFSYRHGAPVSRHMVVEVVFEIVNRIGFVFEHL